MSDFSVNFSFDGSALNRLAADVVRQEAERRQQVLDDVLASHQGQPLDEVKDALRSGWQRLGADFSAPELTQYAEVLARGQRIILDSRTE